MQVFQVTMESWVFELQFCYVLYTSSLDMCLMHDSVWHLLAAKLLVSFSWLSLAEVSLYMWLWSWFCFPEKRWSESWIHVMISWSLICPEESSCRYPFNMIIERVNVKVWKSLFSNDTHIPLHDCPCPGSLSWSLSLADLTGVNG